MEKSCKKSGIKSFTKQTLGSLPDLAEMPQAQGREMCICEVNVNLHVNTPINSLHAWALYVHSGKRRTFMHWRDAKELRT